MSETDEQAIRGAVAELEVRLALQRRAGRELLAGLKAAAEALRWHGHDHEAEKGRDAVRRALAILEEA